MNMFTKPELKERRHCAAAADTPAGRGGNGCDAGVTYLDKGGDFLYISRSPERNRPGW